MERRARASLLLCGAVLLWTGCRPAPSDAVPPTAGDGSAVRFACGVEGAPPCPLLVAHHAGRRIPLEPSALVWSPRFGRALVVTDNADDLAPLGAGHFAISSFDPAAALDPARPAREVEVTPLLSPEQARTFALDDLEGLALAGERLYAMGSMSLDRRDPERDSWRRNRFVQMDLVASDGGISAANLSNVSERWPDFRDWLLSESGHAFSGDAIRGRADGPGINVEGLCATASGHLLIGFRGPASDGSGALVLEIALPDTPQGAPSLVATRAIPEPLPGAPPGAPRGVRDLARIPGSDSQLYVLMGARGPEKEPLVLARWDVATGAASTLAALPPGFVAEGLAPLPDGRLLLVDDLRARLMIASLR